MADINKKIIKTEIIKIIEEAKGLPVPVGKNANLCIDLGFDPISFIRLLLKIEETYAITFGIAEMEICLQVEQLIALVQKKLS